MAVRGQAAADISSGTNPISGSIITATTKFVSSAAASNSVPSFDTGGGTNGIGVGTNNDLILFAASNPVATLAASQFTIRSDATISWRANTGYGIGPDLSLSRDTSNTLAQKNGANDQLFRKYGGNSGLEEWGSISENLTLSTGGTTTDTAANLLPANSYIEAVTARITTTIATATNWAVGDPTTSARFSAANGTLTSGTTSVGITQVDQTGAAGPKQTAAAKVRITTTGTPSAGAIRLTSYYRSYTPATS